MPKLKPLAEQVIVITGGSSGIGLATAQAAAAAGARVVIAARTRDALMEAVDAINQQHGPGRATFVEADVAERESHERIAAHAIERFSRIDTWVNDAGVLLFGKLDELAEADMRRLFDTNFWGVVHGSLVAARHLRAEGGAIINVGSIESERGVPLQGIYAASKHAVKGFTEVLRTELAHEGAPISVTLIKPGSIGSPLVHHTRSIEGHEPQLPPPLYTPEEAAAVILHAAEHPTRTAYVGGAARLIGLVSATMPRFVDWASQKFLVSGQVSDRPANGDNLYDGESDARVRGDHQSGMRPSLYGAAARNPMATLAVAGGAAAAAGLFLWSRAGAETVMKEEVEAGESNPLEGV